MRFRILSVIAVFLLAASAARAQSDQNAPPANGETMRPAGPAMPAWQAVPGGYGGWHGGDCCHDSCCGSCDSCCGSCCRPGLICRLKALKCRICARWACRRCCRSCCGCGSCCGDGYVGHDVPPEGMPTAPRQGDLLPVPPSDSAPYTGDYEETMPEQSPHRPTSARTQVKKQRYSMPVTAAAKTTKKKKKQS